MAAETGFLIDGTVYEVPSLDSLDMAERRVMYDLCGIVQEDFVRELDESEEDHNARTLKLTRHPGFMEALMHIAYQRGNPKAKSKSVQLVVDRTNYLDAISAMVADDEEDDAVPLALTRQPDDPLPSKTASPPTSSGADSSNGSDPPGSPPATIGTGRSVTSSPALPEREPVA